MDIKYDIADAFKTNLTNYVGSEDDLDECTMTLYVAQSIIEAVWNYLED